MTALVGARLRAPGRFPTLGAAVLAAVLAAALAVIVYQHNPGWMYDAKVYRMGGAAALHGQDVYRRLPPPAFTYPPFAAVLFIPLSLLPVNGIGVLWTATSIVCLGASIWLCLGRPAIDRDMRLLLLWAAVCALAIWLDPVSLTLLLGQVNLILMFVVLLDLSLVDGNRWKGLGIGIAAGIKLVPAFFILYLLLTRRFRAAAVAVAGMAATVALAFAALPRDSSRYWGGVFLDSSRVGDPQNIRSQSLRSLIVRWMHTSQAIEPAWIVLGAAVAVAALGLALWAHRRGEELLAVCVSATGGLLISPITWQHHWVWMVPALLWLARRAWQTRSRWLWAITAIIAVEFYVRPYIWGMRVDPVADLHLGIWQLLQSSTYAMTALLFLSVAALTMFVDGRQALRVTSHQTSTPPDWAGGRPSNAVKY